MSEVNKYPGQLVFGLDIGTRSIVGTVGYKIGEKFFESLKKDLLSAKKYILIEFFLISNGKLLDEIFEILKEGGL